MAPGDEIAIFTPDGSICAGVQIWDGNNIAITAWGDDTQTTTIDGLRSGEEMNYHLWDESEGMEYQATATTYVVGDGIYTVNSFHVLSSLTLALP